LQDYWSEGFLPHGAKSERAIFARKVKNYNEVTFLSSEYKELS